MAYKVAYFSIRKPDDFLPRNDKDYYDDEDYDPNEFPNNGVTRARVNENIAYAALGEFMDLFSQNPAHKLQNVISFRNTTCRFWK